MEKKQAELIAAVTKAISSAPFWIARDEIVDRVLAVVADLSGRERKPGKKAVVNIEKRIGDPTREKYVALLGRCYELGYITVDEREERAAAILVAKTMSDINSVVGDLNTDDWNDYWQELRSKGLRPKSKIAPVPQRAAPRALSRAERRFILFAVWAIGIWVIVATIFLIVMVIS
jgi:hypothetical protein